MCRAPLAVRLTDINAGPQALVAGWGMTDDVKIDRHIAILAASSLLFSCVVFPILFGLFVHFWGGRPLSFQLLQEFGYYLLTCFFGLIPSLFYWFFAIWLLSSGTSPEKVHLTYWMLVVPFTCLLAAYTWLSIMAGFSGL